jgi:hypothetical protein
MKTQISKTEIAKRTREIKKILDCVQLVGNTTDIAKNLIEQEGGVNVYSLQLLEFVLLKTRKLISDIKLEN